MPRYLLAALIPALAVASPARADHGAVRHRGTVVSYEGDRLTLRRAGGSPITVLMNPRTRVYVATGGRLRDIKPESYIGVVAAPGPDPRSAEAVTVFSATERGFEAGTQPWDGRAGATFTAGWIAGVKGAGSEGGGTEGGGTEGGRPRRVSLRYEGGTAAFAIPPGTPVTRLGVGERAMLVPGAAVTVFTHAEPDGAVQAGVVAVGRRGVVPTL